LKLTQMSNLEWDEMTREDQNELVKTIMTGLFTIDDSYIPALISAIDEYYSLIEDMDPLKQGVCASFIMGLQNYTTVLAHHMAMIEGTWEVRGDHVDMAKEVLYDLYQNLIHWLESEVKVGSGDKEKKALASFWRDSYRKAEVWDFDDRRGTGWAKKSEVMVIFGKLANLNSKSTINAKFNDYGAKMFEETREGVRVYVRLRPDYMDKGGNSA